MDSLVLLERLPPGWVLLAGGVGVAFVPRRLRPAWVLAVPVLSALHLLALPSGHVVTMSWLGLDLTPVRVDGLSLPFGLVFHLAALLAMVYALHVKDVLQHAAAFVYAGAAIGAVFAGDLLSLFVFWELTALASAFLVFAGRSQRSSEAGLRYLIIHVGSGALLLAGAVLQWRDSGSLDFGAIGLDGIGGTLIFLSFGIKCAFPLLHNWMQDAYPESTVTGTVFLSVFTTKLAVYALARGYAGTPLLVVLGAIMTVFPVFYAAIENDLRRVLAYSLNNQLGFMVVGIGVGTAVAVNGAVAHAVSHVIYKALLFMSMGAVLHRTGTIKASELGGLYKSMPWTTAFCIVGAVSISGFPLFSGFVSKSLVMGAVAEGHHTLVWLALVFASAGVLHHSGIKIPFAAFFGHDSGRRCEEAPLNMLVAMGIGAAACLLIGVAPGLLYALLPYPVDYRPYTLSHVVSQTQLLFWAGLAFAWLLRTGRHPEELPLVNLDVDWLYRRLVPRLVHRAAAGWSAVSDRVTATAHAGVARALTQAERYVGPTGTLARTWPLGSTVLWVVFLLGMVLLLYYGSLS